MILPSKELLENVLNIKLRSGLTATCKENEYHYIELGKVHQEKVNIHELAHKDCKDWASTKGFYIIQDTRGFTKVAKSGTNERKFWEDKNMDNSIERIFQACEWVLNQIKTGDGVK